MRRLAKAPSAFTSGRSASIAVLAFAMASVLLLLNATGASAATKYYDSNFGTTSGTATAAVPPTPSGTAFGGFFSSSNGGVGDIAVNESSTSDGNGTDGWIYVVDRGNNRVQAFDQNRNFKWAIGRDVIASTVNEAQVLNVNATAGKFKLEFNGTPSVELDWNAPFATVDNALDTLVGGVDGNVIVTGTPANGTTVPVGRYAIQFAGTFAAANQPQVAVLPGTPSLTGSASTETIADGVAAVPGNLGTTVVEKCTVATHCKAGTTGSLGGEFNVAAGIDVDQATGHFFVSERNNNRRVQEFTADGGFVRVFGWDVVQPGGAGENVVVFDERQSIQLDDGGFGGFGGVVGGTFKLSFNGQETAAAIPYNATPAQVQAALESLSNIAPGDIVVSSANAGGGSAAGGPWTVDFGGAYDNTDVAQIVGINVNLVNGMGVATSTVLVTTVVPGGPGPAFETCTVAAQCQGGGTGAGGNNAGQFGSSGTNINGLAVAPVGAPNAGRVYVADPANQRILPFTVPAGPTDPVVPGTPIGSAAKFTNSGWPRDVAADSNGVVYGSLTGGGGSTNANGEVVRFDTVLGGFLSNIDPESDDLVLDRGIVTNLEVDRSSDHLVVARAVGTGGDGPAFADGVVEIDVSDNPANVGAEDVVEVHAQGLGIYSTASPTALGIGDGRYLLSTSVASGATGLGQRVLVLDETGIDPPPTVTLLPPTDVAATTATLNATINPNGPTGFPTSYHFEISKDGSNWASIGGDQLAGDGGAPVAIDDPVTGLEANTLYHVRVVTTRSPAAGTKVSSELTFVTDPAPPAVETIVAQQVTDSSAYLVGRVNPGGLASTYWFEWGEDITYGNVVPVPAAPATGSLSLLVAEQISGLDPATAHHFRLCAQNALAPTPVCGADVSFATRLGAASAPSDRAYEMVSSPDKLLRRGGQSPSLDVDFAKFAEALPAASGESVLWGIFAGAVDPDAGTGFTRDTNPEVRRRGPNGWYGEAVFSEPMSLGVSAPVTEPKAFSADLNTQVLASTPSVFPGGIGGTALRVFGDAGGPIGAGWYPLNETSVYTGLNTVRITDGGDQLAADGFLDESGLRNLTPLDGGPKASQLSPPQTSGPAIFSYFAPAWGPSDLVNECTGSGASATALPSRGDAGTPGVPGDDVILPRACSAGAPTEVRGAELSTRTTLSADGRRVFFQAPNDVLVSSAEKNVCATATGAGTACPPQLFVRQYDDSGEATVRWISRAEDALFNAPQQIDLYGNGVSLEGTSRDGSVVYFRTNAPLTADDPNGQPLTPTDPRPVLTGTASPKSWDLYRYELPGDNNVDPAGGELTRISGGPDGNADPNTNCSSATAECGGIENGGGGAVRFMSDDGGRVYFATAAQIPTADNALPAGGVTTPTSAGAQVNVAARNLYLYDADKSGAAAYKFIARVPWSDASGLAACLSQNESLVGPTFYFGKDTLSLAVSGDCVHGSSSGDAITFLTAAQLTKDDLDQAADVYLYDSASDELVRLSAPEPGATPYLCVTSSSSVPLLDCNADNGLRAGSFSTMGNDGGAGYALDGLRGWNVGEDAQGDLEAVHFESRLPLATGAADNDAMKVYEWRRDGGRLSLVSPAGSPYSAFYTGSSQSGDDIFFWTQQRISGREIDADDGDIYNATSRPDPIGDPPPVPPACDVLADACQGVAPIPPPASGASSAALSGTGNVVERAPRKCPQGKTRRGKRCVKKAGKRGKRTANQTGRAHR